MKLLLLFEQTIKQKSGSKRYLNKKVYIKDLNEKMYLAEEVLSASGVIIGSYKQRVSKTLMVTLDNYLKNKEIKEPISILEYIE